MKQITPTSDCGYAFNEELNCYTFFRKQGMHITPIGMFCPLENERYDEEMLAEMIVEFIQTF